MADKPDNLTRRAFIRTSLAGSALLATAGLARGTEGRSAKAVDTSPGPDLGPLPKRKLGRSGIEVTILTLGGHMDILSPEFYDKAWNMGIRRFDVADCYRGGESERIIAQWLERHPERRKELFLVTKDHPHEGPQQLLKLIDRRLEALQTDYVDLYFIHGMGPGEYGEAAIDWLKSKELREVAEKLKKSGKIRLFGFSCHDPEKTRILRAAVEGGFTDAVMVAYSPIWNPSMVNTTGQEFVNQDLYKRDEFMRVLDDAYRAGIGLVSMKQCRLVHHLPPRLPAFQDLGLSTHQAALMATWTDERIASVCSWIDNHQQLEENTYVARNFKPLTDSQIKALRTAPYTP